VKEKIKKVKKLGSKKVSKPAEAQQDDEKQPDKTPGESKEGTQSKSASRPCYRVFLGNIPNSAGEPNIRRFLRSVPHISGIRILTDKDTGESRGCAFVDFDHVAGEKKALLLHNSLMDGRRVRVEPSADGRGKSEKRLQKLETLKKKAQQMRQERVKEVKKLQEEGVKTRVRTRPKSLLSKPEQAVVDEWIAAKQMNDDARNYLERQSDQVRRLIMRDFRPPEDVRDPTGVLIKFGEGMKLKMSRGGSVEGKGKGKGGKGKGKGGGKDNKKKVKKNSAFHDDDDGDAKVDAVVFTPSS